MSEKPNMDDLQEHQQVPNPHYEEEDPEPEYCNNCGENLIESGAVILTCDCCIMEYCSSCGEMGCPYCD